MNTDTYATLEFQGYVVGVPTYDRENKILSFRAKTLSFPTMQFKASGESAKAFKSLLHAGVLVQLSATPKAQLISLGDGKKASIIEWEAKRLSMLGRKKIELGNYADRKILDGLMPLDDEITDVGYVEPITFERAMEKKRQAKERADKAKEEMERDKDLF